MTYRENIVSICQESTGTDETIENNINLKFIKAGKQEKCKEMMPRKRFFFLGGGYKNDQNVIYSSILKPKKGPEGFLFWQHFTEYR